ncbi:MAG: cardiolipin synthase [Treponema sp. CETP13]|nr:MAG: cardiolipin synthase [Treponema sp. CETP13]
MESAQTAVETIWPYVFTLITIVNYIVIAYVLFLERKQSESRFAWLLALVFLPILGLLLYILFSGHFFNKPRHMEAAKKSVSKFTESLVLEQKKFFYSEHPKIHNDVMRDYFDLVDLNLKYAHSPVTFADSETIFLWGQDKFERLYEDIECAVKCVYIEYYIFRNDKTGTRIMDLLCKKAREGLDVKLLYDDWGCMKTPKKFFGRLDKAGGMTLTFSPIKKIMPLTLNFRTHRKIIVIDEKIAYMGGTNIGDEYANLTSRVWRDTHLRLSGSCVYSVLSVFLIDWFSVATGRKAKRKYPGENFVSPETQLANLNRQILNDIKNDVPGDPQVPTQIITSGPDDIHKTEIKDAIMRLISSSKKSVFIQTPYFTPDSSFYSVLRVAALSGVDVQIMVPTDWDHWFVRDAAFVNIQSLMSYGIKFYAYPGFIHSKTIVVDGKVSIIGSANIDTRSFDLLYEIDTIFYDENFAKKNVKIFMEDREKSFLHQLAWFENRPILQRAVWGFARLFAPLM